MDNLPTLVTFNAWLIAFGLTIIIEVTFGLLIRLVCHNYLKLNLFDSLTYSFTCFLLASVVTHPILWFILPHLSLYLGFNSLDYLIFGEGFVFIYEALWYRHRLPRLLSYSRFGPLGLSMILNTMSWSLGAWLLQM